jgi:ribonucleoside-diphosphate reductase beta chain
MSDSTRPARILDPGMCLTLRPMAYPAFFEMYKDAIKNTWSVDEVDFATDSLDLHTKDDGRRDAPRSAPGRVLRHG